MSFRDFSVKINSENNSDNTKNGLFYEFSAKSLAQKVQNVVYLSEIMART